MNVSSGPRRECIVRNGIFMLMCLGMGGYFLYDGWLGYPAQNHAEFLLQLPANDREKAENARIYETANQARIANIADVVKTATPADRRAVLEREMGGPPSFENADAIYYFGRDALIKIEKSGDRLKSEIIPVPGKHTLKDFNTQWILGNVVGGIGLYMLVFVIRVVRTRATVTESGLTLNCRKPIPFASMQSLDTADFRRKGRIYLKCHDSDGRGVLLDEYHYADFDKIMAALCERKGFDDPVAAEKADKAKRAAGAEPDEPTES